MSENQKDQRVQGNQNGQQQNQKGQQKQNSRNQYGNSPEEDRETLEDESEKEQGTSIPGHQSKTPVAGQENPQLENKAQNDDSQAKWVYL